MTRRSMMKMGTPAVREDALSLHISGRLLSAPPEVLSIEGEEAVNGLYEFRVRFTLDPRDELAGDRTLLNMPVVASLGWGAVARMIHGVVAAVTTEAGLVGHRPVYRLTLRPRAHLLERRRYCRIFQDQSILQIVTTLFTEHRVVFRLRLAGQYQIRAYVVQYHESDWEFATRLLAESGVSFFFDHPRGQGDAIETGLGNSEVLVLCDTSQYYAPLDGGADLLARIGAPAVGLELPENAITDFSLKSQPATTVRLVRAYDFQRPQTQLNDAQRIELEEEPALVYEFGGEGDESPPDYEHGRVRLEQDRVETTVVDGRSVCRRLAVGRTFILHGHAHAPVDGAYVLASVHHRLFAAAACPPGAPPYENRFVAVPSAVLLRPAPPRKRAVMGTETAVVVGPPGVEQHVDSHGRIKVQFHWDLASKFDGQNACWIRVAQSLSGTGWGDQYLPRVGMEVVVTFLGGDPDRPLVTHSVYNATHPLPFAVPQQVTKSGIRTSSTPGGDGYHELSMDDAAGKERLFIHAQRDADRVVRNDDTEKVGNDQHSSVARDRKTEIGRIDEAVIGEKHVRAIGGGSSTGTSMQDGDVNLTTGGATLSLAGDNATLDAAGTINLSAGSAIHLKAPLVTIEADVVEVKGSGVINVESGGIVSIKGAFVKVTGATITEN